MLYCPCNAGVAQLVEQRLPKPCVASSNLVFRSSKRGDVAEWLGNGLQNRSQQFDSARRLHSSTLRKSGFLCFWSHSWDPARTKVGRPAIARTCRIRLVSGNVFQGVSSTFSERGSSLFYTGQGARVDSFPQFYRPFAKAYLMPERAKLCTKARWNNRKTQTVGITIITPNA